MKIEYAEPKNIKVLCEKGSSNGVKKKYEEVSLLWYGDGITGAANVMYTAGLSALTHWAWVSRFDTISHALTPSM